MFHCFAEISDKVSLKTGEVFQQSLSESNETFAKIYALKLLVKVPLFLLKILVKVTMFLLKLLVKVTHYSLKLLVKVTLILLKLAVIYRNFPLGEDVGDRVFRTAAHVS